MVRNQARSRRLTRVDHAVSRLLQPLLLGSALMFGVSTSAGAEPAHSGPLQQPTVQNPAGDILYTVRPDDTLIGIARERLDHPDRWQDVQRYNGISHPRRLPPGTVLKLRPEWLKRAPPMATLASVSNEVQLDRAPAQSGAQFTEGSMIQTGSDSTAVITLPDGTVLRIPSASQVRLERLRAYHGEEDLEALFELEKGSIEPRTEPRKRSRPLEIRTPAGNAAVRGTHFRVQAQAQHSTIEVLRGQVEAGNSAGLALVDQGNGAYVKAGVAPQVEPLLPAPDLSAIDDKRVNVAAPRFELPALNGAVAYRIEVSTQEDFSTVLLDTRVQQPVLGFQSKQDGPHFIRVRGISARSLEGHDSLARIDVQARSQALQLVPTPPILNAGLHTLSWRAPAATDGSRRYRLQIATDAAFRYVLHDQILRSPQAALQLHARPPLSRWWRVAIIEKGKQGPFTPAGHFVIQAPAPGNKAQARPPLASGARNDGQTDSAEQPQPGH